MPSHRTDASSLPGFDDAASSLSRASTKVSHMQTNAIDISEHRPTKRRKAAGLNARFDRMIKSVNTTMLSHRISTTASSRKRMQSSGTTSSVSSHDVPKTPVDAYSSRHPGKLGKDFSVLKMTKSSLLLREHYDGFPKPATPPREARNPLPDWLANTFCSLETGNPLRELLSPSHDNRKSKLNSLAMEILAVSQAEELFAFSPFDSDKREQLPGAPDRPISTLNVRKNLCSVVPTDPVLSNRQPKASTNPLPFSTPGHFAPVPRSKSSIVRGSSPSPMPLVRQVTFHATNMMQPPAVPAFHLRLNDTIKLPQPTRACSNLVENNNPPSDFQEHTTYICHNYQSSRGVNGNPNVYVTPGPTFACSRPVYFDSPTEDPSLSDPLQPESYELDLNDIDFRWRPFLRSVTQESDANERFTSPSPPLRYAVPNQAGDESRWNALFGLDQGEYGASSNEHPSLAADVETAHPHLEDVGAIVPSNLNTPTTLLRDVNDVIKPWSSPINDAQQAVLKHSFVFTSRVSLSPLGDQPEPTSLTANGVIPRGDGENIRVSEDEIPLLYTEETRVDEWEAREILPSTPIRQVPISLPSAPQKVRPSQSCGATRVPVCKTSSALSWMMPLKFSKRPIVTQDDDIRRLSCISGNSHDSIESWDETG